jgi:SHS2 domain-containing protein
MGSYAYFDHTADVGMTVDADSFEDLLATACNGMLHIMLPEVERIPRETTREVDVAGDDPALVLFDLLAEVLFLFETEGLALPDATVTQTASGRYRATLRGGRFDPDQQALGSEVKAVTYHRLEAKQEDGRWRATVIFDI